VFIEGKELVIGFIPDFGALPANWLALRVESPGELALACDTLVKEADLRGLYAFGTDPERLWAWFRAGYLLVQAAGGAVADGAGRLLGIHRLGRWDLPKGKMEAGEGREEAALREVGEECGLRHLQVAGPLCETWHTYRRNGAQHLKCTYWFLMHGDALEPLVAQAEEDIDAVQWLDAEGRSRLRRDTYPSLLPVITAWEEAVRDPA